MKKLIDKLMAHFGYYTRKGHYDLFAAEAKQNAARKKPVPDFPVEAPAKKKPAVRKATTRIIKKEK
jgi:hypothetical protein